MIDRASLQNFRKLKLLISMDMQRETMHKAANKQADVSALPVQAIRSCNKRLECERGPRLFLQAALRGGGVDTISRLRTRVRASEVHEFADDRVLRLEFLSPLKQGGRSKKGRKHDENQVRVQSPSRAASH